MVGEWKGNYTGADQSQLGFYYLTLKQEGEKVTGEYFNPRAGAQRRPIKREVSGTFKDGVFGWGNVRGTVAGDSMTGSFPAQAGQILNFTAIRTKK